MASRLLSLGLVGLALLGMNGCQRPPETSEAMILRELSEGVDPKLPTVSIVVLSSRPVELQQPTLETGLRRAGFEGAPFQNIRSRQWLVLLGDTLCLVTAYPQSYFSEDLPSGGSPLGVDLGRRHKGAWLVDVLRVVKDGKDLPKTDGMREAGKLASALVDEYAIGLFSVHQDRLLAASPAVFEGLAQGDAVAEFEKGVMRLEAKP